MKPARLKFAEKLPNIYFSPLGEELCRKEKPQSPHSTDGKLTIIGDAQELLKVT